MSIFLFFIYHLFSFIVFILCSNLYIIVDFCAKNIFFYDIYVKDGQKKKKISFLSDFFIYLSISLKPKKYIKNIILTFPFFLSLFFVLNVVFFYVIRAIQYIYIYIYTNLRNVV